MYIYIYIYICLCWLDEGFQQYHPTFWISNILAFPLVGASNVGGFLRRCDPLTQTLFVFRC